MNHCSCKYCLKLWHSFLALANSTYSSHCCFAANGKANWCSTGCAIKCIVSWGRIWGPWAYLALMASFTRLSTMFCWALGELCRAPLWCSHISHATFKSFLISSTVHHLQDFCDWPISHNDPCWRPHECATHPSNNLFHLICSWSTHPLAMGWFGDVEGWHHWARPWRIASAIGL